MNAPIDVKNSSVTISLNDYENVRKMNHNYKTLRQQIKAVIVDHELKGEDAIITVDTAKAEKLIKLLAEDDIKFEYVDVRVHWE